LLKKPAVIIPAGLRHAVAQACLERLDKEQATVWAIAVGGQHAHVAFEWAWDDVKPMIGRVKKVSSHRVRTELPGRIWSLGCKIVRVRDESHWCNVLNYVKKQRDAWVWSAG
jgi:REP element-mobilizing transposase RayT